ncbi:AI-2E family transporter [Alkalilimnicola sp. S0819]|uniref:AI-2E family transporter n=1 Tax=Alkalilimnicola sp. S0819 TaxID=2613922 RepID=UPI001261BF39|nr:AI-2E family transporter [Alkalilimnicola sp. S0819]KAB7624369.1 AI-2E family transporter [Alkalilimnicola sp. S0819]MPQ16195.1 AI-2E family transporter [Alkalilimnicola sp. S0819]
MASSNGVSFYTRTFALLTLLGLGYLLYQVLSPLLAPLTWGVLLAFLLHPLHRWLCRRLRHRRNLSAGLLTLLSLLLITGPLTALTAAFVGQLRELLELVAQLADANANRPLETMPVISGPLLWLRGLLNIDPGRLAEWSGKITESGLGQLAELSGKVLLGAVGRVFGLGITLFSLFFFIRDGSAMLGRVRRMIPLPIADRERLFSHVAEVTYAVIYGNVLTAVVQGLMVGVGFAVTGLPSPVVFGALAALFALLPLAGTPLVWGPAVIALLMADRWISAALMLAWGLLVASSDNVLRAVLISGRGHIGTLTVFIGIIGGAMAFGMIGLVTGPLILALAIALARFVAEQTTT